MIYVQVDWREKNLSTPWWLMVEVGAEVEAWSAVVMNIQMRRKVDDLHVDFPLKSKISLSYLAKLVDLFLPIAACNSPGELNCNFSHSYG